MQSLTWYTQRLRAMGPSEVLWRVRGVTRDAIDRIRLSRRWAERLAERLAAADATAVPVPALAAIPVGKWRSPSAAGDQTVWYGRLAERAERIAQNRLTFFDQRDVSLGDPIDWQRDVKSGVTAPMIFAASIDYRDVRVAGDCKFVWEPNRHAHLVVLARAWRAGGDQRFATAAAKQLESWLDACPFGVGMNWRSPLELAIRLINWVWTLDLFGDCEALSPALRRRLHRCAGLHVWEIARKYSRGSSANNHLVGEAAGVWIASNYFPLRDARRHHDESRRVLCEQILAQTFADGGSREQALGYLVFSAQFFLLAGLVGRRVGRDFPVAYWQRLERMFEFLAALAEGGQRLPMFGDADDGYVLDLDGDPLDVRPWLGVAAIVFGRADWIGAAGSFPEAAEWLLGPSSRAAFDGLALERPAASLELRELPHSGYYLLQCGQRDDADRISVLFDCGPLGYGALAAHGHADALSFTLRTFGVDVLVDPGTYDYFSYPHWRAYFRSTRAHNTIEVDGLDQSQMEGLFLWGTRADARCTRWEPTPTGGAVTGEHDGYLRLATPVLHRRTLTLDGESRRLEVHDEIVTSGPHDVAVCFHVAENCRVTQSGKGCFDIDTGRGTVTIGLDSQLSVQLVTANEDPPGGWVSRGYHCRMPSTTLVGRCRCSGALQLTCRIDVGAAGGRGRVARRERPLTAVSG